MFAELEYAIGLAEGWGSTSAHTYERSDPWSILLVRPIGRSVGRTLMQQADSVRSGLQQETENRWPSYSLFEFTSLEEVSAGEQVVYELRYRAQEAPRYCVLSVVERVSATEGWHGLTTGIRAITWMCEADAAGHSALRQATLDTLRVTARPSDYYTQALISDGVLIKAAAKVNPDALSAAGRVIGWLLGTARHDVADCMGGMGAGLAIIPRDEFVTSLPEFAVLSGRSDFTGRTYDSFAIRGLGAVKGQPVSATSEETLLGIGAARDLNVTVHEFAHAIQNLCFTPADHQKWGQFYAEALSANVFPGTHAMHDVQEFFAVFSSSYFGVTDELGNRNTSREMIRSDFRDIFESLEEIYGTSSPPRE